MASDNARAGIFYVKVGGKLIEASGNFTYNLGQPKREGVLNSYGVAGFKETAQVPYIEGEVLDSNSIDLVNDLLAVEDATVTLELRNGKVIALRNAWYAAEGQGNTENGTMQVRFEGRQAGYV